MIMGGPIHMPQMRTMEIDLRAGGDHTPKITSLPNMSMSSLPPFSRNSSFSTRRPNHFIKIFGPRRINLGGSAGHNLSIGDMIAEGINELEKLGPSLVKSINDNINVTTLNNTLHTVEQNIEDGAKTFENLLNSTFESNMDKAFDDFFGDENTSQKETTKAPKGSVEVKSFVSHKEHQKHKDHKEKDNKNKPINKHNDIIPDHHQKRVIIDDSLIPKKEIEMEIAKTVQVNKYPKKELNKEIKKEVYEKPKVTINKVVTGKLNDFDLEEMFHKRNIIIFIAVIILLVLMVIIITYYNSMKEEKSSTEKKFLENLPFNENKFNDKNSINRSHLY